MFIPCDNIIPLTVPGSGALSTHVLTIGNAARAAGAALESATPAAQAIAEAGRAEHSLASDAAALCLVLTTLAQRLNDLRACYR